MQKQEGYTSISHHPERNLWTALTALQMGRSLGRPMTEAERLVIALTGAQPTHMLTLHKGDDGRNWSALWPATVKRINRARSRPGPLVYFGCRAQSLGYSDQHLHVLLWDFLWAPMLHRIARQLGLGAPQLTRVPTGVPDAELLATAQIVSYVVGQHTPVFASNHHLRHRVRPRSQRRWFYPRRVTLGREMPQLLAAVEKAKSPLVSDMELALELPRFRSNRG